MITAVKILAFSSKYKAVEQTVSSLQCRNTWLPWRSSYAIAYSSTVCTKSEQTSRQSLYSDGFYIHDVEHMYNKGHTEGVKKKKKQTHEHMYLLIGDLSGHGSTCPESQRDKRLWP